MKQYGLNGSYYNEEMSSVKTLDLLPRYIYMSYSIAFTYRVKPVSNDHPSRPEKVVFSGRWSLVRGLHHTTVYECETVRAWRSGL